MSSSRRTARKHEGQPWGFFRVFAVLFLLWLGLSEKYDLFHLAVGLGSAILVAAVCLPLLRTEAAGSGSRTPFVFSFPWRRLVTYVPWLLWQLLVANVQMAYLVLHPRLPIRPQVVRFRSGLSGDVSRMALANAITLTPGTCTIDVTGEEVVVHALSTSVARSLEAGDILRRTAHVFEPPSSGAAAETPLDD